MLLLYFSLLWASVSLALGLEDDCRGICPDYNPHDEVILLPHANCDKFCTCDSGKPVEIDCPDGLHFSEEDQMCAFPIVANCNRSSHISPVSSELPAFGIDLDRSIASIFWLSSECKGQCPAEDISGRSTLLAHRLCSKFCRCKNGVAYPMDCTPGLHFNPDYGLCVDPSIANCVEETTTKPDDCPCRGSTMPTTSTTTIDPCPCLTTPKLTTLPYPTCTPCPTCPTCAPCSTTSSTTPTPSTTDSTTLSTITTPIPSTITTTTTTEKPTSTTTPATTSTSTESSTASTPCSCRTTEPTTSTTEMLTSSTEPSSTLTSTPVTSTTESEKTTKQNVFGCVGDCPDWNSPDHTDHIPHEHCSKFCKCDNGIPFVFDCPLGLHFNPELEVCDHPANAMCEGIKLLYI